jgi:hypothetical protein
MDRLIRAFTVNAAEHDLLTTWPAASFSITSETDAIRRALYMQPSTLRSFANIATSNNIREGASGYTGIRDLLPNGNLNPE